MQIGQKQLIVGCKNMKFAMSLVHLGNLRLPDNRAGWNSAQPNYTESKVDCSCVLGIFCHNWPHFQPRKKKENAVFPT